MRSEKPQKLDDSDRRCIVADTANPIAPAIIVDVVGWVGVCWFTFTYKSRTYLVTGISQLSSSDLPFLPNQGLIGSSALAPAPAPAPVTHSRACCANSCWSGARFGSRGWSLPGQCCCGQARKPMQFACGCPAPSPCCGCQPAARTRRSWADSNPRQVPQRRDAAGVCYSA